MALLPATLPAQVAGEIRGRIVDANSSRPIVGGRVELSGRSDGVTTTGDGLYVVRGVEPRAYVVTVRAVGYLAAEREILVSNGRTTHVDVALAPVVTTLRDIAVTAVRDTQPLGSLVFDRAAIEASGSRDVSELLQTAPGVVITRTGGAGQSSRISMRGSSASQVLVLVDGIPLNSVTSGSADLSLISLETISKVTVLTGAQSARYGPRAMAGVVDIETRRPRREVSSFARSGSFGERNVSASLGNASSNGTHTIGASLTGDYRFSRGDIPYDVPAVRGGGRAARINSDAESRQLVGGITLDRSSVAAAMRGTWQDTERGLAGSIVQQSASGRQENRRWSAGGSAQGRARSIAWSGAADFTNERGVFRDSSPPFGDAFNDTLDASGVTASATASVQGRDAALSLGAEGRALSVQSTMLSASAPRRQELAGAWFNGRYSRLLGERWHVDGEAGARADYSSLLRETAISPRVSVRVSRSRFAASVSVASGFAPPTLADQFFHEGVQVRANANLAPERTRRDVQARVTVRDIGFSHLQLSGDAAAFRSDIDGMILWMPDFRFIWSPSNYDVQRRGWELSGTARIPALRVEIQGNLNRSDVTYSGGVITGQVAYRPRESANTSIAFAPGPIRIEMSNRYIGTRRIAAGTALNALAPYWMSDVGVSSTRDARGWALTLRSGIENAFNRSAAMLVDYPFPPRTWSLSLRVRRSNSQSH